MKELEEYISMKIGSEKYIGKYQATRVPGGLMLNHWQEEGWGETKRVNMTDTFIPFNSLSLRQTLEQL